MDAAVSLRNFSIRSLSSLRGKLILVFVGLSLVIALVATLIAWQANRDTAQSLAKQTAAQVTSRIAAYVDEYTREAELIAGGVKSGFDAGYIPITSERDWEQYFWQASNISQFVRYAYVGTESGLFVGVERAADSQAALVRIRPATDASWKAYSAQHAGDRSQWLENQSVKYDPRVRPWYIAAKQKRTPVFTEPYYSASKKKLVVTYAVPLTDRQGAFQGAIGFDFSLERLAAYINTLPPSENGAVILKSAGGGILAQTGFGEHVDLRDDDEVIATLRSQAVPKATYTWLDGSTLFSVSPLRGAIQGSVAVAIPTLDMWATARKSWFMMLGLTAGLVGLAIVVGMYSLRSVMRDLGTLRQAAKKLELGTSTISLPLTRRDEIGALARTYEALRNRVRDELDRSQQALQLKHSAYEAGKVDLERSDEERRRLARLVDAAHDCIALVNADGVFSYVNERFAQQMRTSAQDIVGKTAVSLLADRRSDATQRIREAMRTGQMARETLLVVGNGGERIYFEVTLTPLPNREGAIEWAVIGRNVTESVNRAQALSEEARIDPVSKLMRRTAMLDVVQQRIDGANPTPFSLLFIDLDGFKAVNDGFGHDAGDHVIARIGEHLREAVREGDFAARFGGDEFIVTISGESHEASAAIVGQRIIAVLQQLGHARFPGVTLSASMGVASFPRDGQSVATLIRLADEAMYVAKNAGGGQVQTWRSLLASQRSNVVPFEPVRGSGTH